jgi:hypothetical protein
VTEGAAPSFKKLNFAIDPTVAGNEKAAIRDVARAT